MSDPQTMRDLYRRRAAAYDRVTRLYRCFGFRDRYYRECAVEGLGVKQGDTVVDLACGTGLNFELLQRQVGPEGRIVGVDVTDAMLERARNRVDAAGWKNVELVEADVADYRFPPDLGGVLSTLAMSLSPEYDRVIAAIADALAPAGALSVLDLKFPERWPHWLVRLGVMLNSGYGVSLDLRDRTPWDSIRMHLDERSYQEFFGGSLYLLVAGVKSGETVNAQVTNGA